MFRIALESGQQLLHALVCKLKDFVAQIAPDVLVAGLHPTTRFAPGAARQVVPSACCVISLAPAQLRPSLSNFRKNSDGPKQRRVALADRRLAHVWALGKLRLVTRLH